MTCLALWWGLLRLASPQELTPLRAAEVVAVAQCDALTVAKVWQESRGDALATSRVVHGRRAIGRYAGPRPRGLAIRGGLYCGILQTQARSWAQCLAMRDDRLAVATFRRELSVWRKACRTRGEAAELTCALGGYAGGWRLAHARNRAAMRTLWLMRRLQRAGGVPHAQSKTPRWSGARLNTIELESKVSKLEAITAIRNATSPIERIYGEELIMQLGKADFCCLLSHCTCQCRLHSPPWAPWRFEALECECWNDDQKLPLCLRHGEDQDCGLSHQMVSLYYARALDSYRVDFVFFHDDGGLIIECDGFDWHERTKQQAIADRQRDRYFNARGFSTLRFLGTEIMHAADDCARETVASISRCIKRDACHGETERRCLDFLGLIHRAQPTLAKSIWETCQSADAAKKAWSVANGVG